MLPLAGTTRALGELVAVARLTCWIETFVALLQPLGLLVTVTVSAVTKMGSLLGLLSFKGIEIAGPSG